MASTGTHVRIRHPQGLASTRDTHGSGGFDPTVSGLPYGMARDGEQTALPDLGPGAVVTGHFDPSAAAPQVDNAPARQAVAPTNIANVIIDADGITILDGALTIKDSLGNTVASDGRWQNGSGTVVIDSGGITISDGALTIEDYTGSSVLGAAGFDGSWTQYLLLGVYNGAFKAGALSSGLTAETEVGSGSTPSQYALSLSSDIPYWVIDTVTGNVTYGISDDATYGRVFQVTKSVAVGGTLSMYQDIPVGSDTDFFSLWLNMLLVPSEFAVAVTCKVYYSQRDSGHAIIGAESGPIDTLTGSTATLDYSSYPYMTNIFGLGVMDEDIRYVRVRLEIALATTAAVHGSKFQLIQMQAKQRSLSPPIAMTPLRDTTASLILDTLQSDMTKLNLLVGENPSAARPLEIFGGGVIISPSSGTPSLGFASSYGGTPDVNLYRGAADVLRTDDVFIGAGLKTYGSTYSYVQFLSSGDTTEALIDWGSGGSNLLRIGVYGTDAGHTFREAMRFDANATVAQIGFFGTAAVARTTWGAPTTTDTRTTFADAVTLTELAKRVGTLIKDLRSLGLLG